MNIRKVILSKYVLGFLTVIGTIVCLYILIRDIYELIDLYNFLTFWVKIDGFMEFWSYIRTNPSLSVYFTYGLFATLITATLTTLGAIFSFRGRDWLMVFISSIAMIIYPLVNYYLYYPGYSLFIFNTLSFTGILSLVLILIKKKEYIFSSQAQKSPGRDSS